MGEPALAIDPVADRPTAADGPDFFCVGAQKGGTRWLYDQVQLHPDFWMPPFKELHYFDRKKPSQRAAKLAAKAAGNLDHLNKRRAKKNFRPLDQRDLDFLDAYADLPWRQVDLDAYARLFASKGGAIAGDITPDYSTLKPNLIEKIMARFPAAKVVFIARDPVARVWSHLNMHVRKGDIARDLSASDLMRLVEKRFVVKRSFQTDIVARWRKHVPDEQFGFYLFDDLVSDPDRVRARVLSFLGGDPGKPSGTTKAGFNRKSDSDKAQLSPELRDRLSKHLADELRASARQFGGAAAEWPARYGL